MEVEERENPHLLNESASLAVLMQDIEVTIDHRAACNPEIERYSDYLISLGGKILTQMPPPEDTKAISKVWSESDRSSFVQAVNPYLLLNKRVISEFSFQDILRKKPKYPKFWEAVQKDGKVQYSIFTQSLAPILQSEVEVGYIGDERVAIPDEIIRFEDEGLIRVYPLPPQGLVLLWPHLVASPTFSFSEVPKDLSRAAKVYFNACDTRRIFYFSDINASHLNYKNPQNGARIAVEYEQNNPTQMRPVLIDSKKF